MPLNTPQSTSRRKNPLSVLHEHHAALHSCVRCPDMIGPVVSGGPIFSKVILVGQAPGPREGGFGKPFAWTAGKTLFRWFESIGVDEEKFRSSIYMAAVCRCFPGKAAGGGDRVPGPAEIEKCGEWMANEFEILEPELVIPVGKLAIGQFMPCERLDAIIGQNFVASRFGKTFDLIPLPHPSGASTWHRTEPGKTLVVQALQKIRKHRAFRDAVQD